MLEWERLETRELSLRKVSLPGRMPIPSSACRDAKSQWDRSVIGSQFSSSGLIDLMVCGAEWDVADGVADGDERSEVLALLQAEIAGVSWWRKGREYFARTVRRLVDVGPAIHRLDTYHEAMAKKRLRA